MSAGRAHPSSALLPFGSSARGLLLRVLDERDLSPGVDDNGSGIDGVGSLFIDLLTPAHTVFVVIEPSIEDAGQKCRR